MLHYRQQIMTALHEVENSLNAGRLLDDQRRQTALTVANAREVLALTERRYELGLTNAAVLLDAQRRLTAARSALISVRRTELENRIDLHLALGGEITLEVGS